MPVDVLVDLFHEFEDQERNRLAPFSLPFVICNRSNLPFVLEFMLQEISI